MASKDPREPFTRIDVAEAKELIAAGDVAVVDVRTPGEYQMAHIPGASLVPVNSIMTNQGQLPADKPIIFACNRGVHSALAAEMAAAMWASNALYNMEGVLNPWLEAGEPVDAVQDSRSDLRFGGLVEDHERVRARGRCQLANFVSHPLASQRQLIRW